MISPRRGIGWQPRSLCPIRGHFCVRPRPSPICICASLQLILRLPSDDGSYDWDREFQWQGNSLRLTHIAHPEFRWRTQLHLRLLPNGGSRDRDRDLRLDPQSRDASLTGKSTDAKPPQPQGGHREDPPQQRGKNREIPSHSPAFRPRPGPGPKRWSARGTHGSDRHGKNREK